MSTSSSNASSSSSNSTTSHVDKFFREVTENLFESSDGKGKTTAFIPGSIDEDHDTKVERIEGDNSEDDEENDSVGPSSMNGLGKSSLGAKVAESTVKSSIRSEEFPSMISSTSLPKGGENDDSNAIFDLSHVSAFHQQQGHILHLHSTGLTSKPSSFICYLCRCKYTVDPKDPSIQTAHYNFHCISCEFVECAKCYLNEFIVDYFNGQHPQVEAKTHDNHPLIMVRADGAFTCGGCQRKGNEGMAVFACMLSGCSKPMEGSVEEKKDEKGAIVVTTPSESPPSPSSPLTHPSDPSFPSLPSSSSSSCTLCLQCVYNQLRRHDCRTLKSSDCTYGRWAIHYMSGYHRHRLRLFHLPPLQNEFKCSVCSKVYADDGIYHVAAASGMTTVRPRFYCPLCDFLVCVCCAVEEMENATKTALSSSKEEVKLNLYCTQHGPPNYHSKPLVFQRHVYSADQFSCNFCSVTFDVPVFHCDGKAAVVAVGKKEGEDDNGVHSDSSDDTCSFDLCTLCACRLSFRRWKIDTKLLEHHLDPTDEKQTEECQKMLDEMKKKKEDEFKMKMKVVEEEQGKDRKRYFDTFEEVKCEAFTTASAGRSGKKNKLPLGWKFDGIEDAEGRKRFRLREDLLNTPLPSTILPLVSPDYESLKSSTFTKSPVIQRQMWQVDSCYTSTYCDIDLSVLPEEHLSTFPTFFVEMAYRAERAANIDEKDFHPKVKIEIKLLDKQMRELLQHEEEYDEEAILGKKTEKDSVGGDGTSANEDHGAPVPIDIAAKSNAPNESSSSDKSYPLHPWSLQVAHYCFSSRALTLPPAVFHIRVAGKNVLIGNFRLYVQSMSFSLPAVPTDPNSLCVALNANRAPQLKLPLVGETKEDPQDYMIVESNPTDSSDPSSGSMFLSLSQEEDVLRWVKIPSMDSLDPLLFNDQTNVVGFDRVKFKIVRQINPQHTDQMLYHIIPSLMYEDYKKSKDGPPAKKKIEDGDDNEEEDDHWIFTFQWSQKGHENPIASVSCLEDDEHHSDLGRGVVPPVFNGIRIERVTDEVEETDDDGNDDEDVEAVSGEEAKKTGGGDGLKTLKVTFTHRVIADVKRSNNVQGDVGMDGAGWRLYEIGVHKAADDEPKTKTGMPRVIKMKHHDWVYELEDFTQPHAFLMAPGGDPTTRILDVPMEYYDEIALLVTGCDGDSSVHINFLYEDGMVYQGSINGEDPVVYDWFNHSGAVYFPKGRFRPLRRGNDEWDSVFTSNPRLYHLVFTHLPVSSRMKQIAFRKVNAGGGNCWLFAVNGRKSTPQTPPKFIPSETYWLKSPFSALTVGVPGWSSNIEITRKTTCATFKIVPFPADLHFVPSKLAADELNLDREFAGLTHQIGTVPMIPNPNPATGVNEHSEEMLSTLRSDDGRDTIPLYVVDVANLTEEPVVVHLPTTFTVKEAVRDIENILYGKNTIEHYRSSCYYNYYENEKTEASTEFRRLMRLPRVPKTVEVTVGRREHFMPGKGKLMRKGAVLNEESTLLKEQIGGKETIYFLLEGHCHRPAVVSFESLYTMEMEGQSGVEHYSLFVRHPESSNFIRINYVPSTSIFEIKNIALSQCQHLGSRFSDEKKFKEFRWRHFLLHYGRVLAKEEESCGGAGIRPGDILTLVRMQNVEGDTKESGKEVKEKEKKKGESVKTSSKDKEKDKQDDASQVMTDVYSEAYLNYTSFLSKYSSSPSTSPSPKELDKEWQRREAQRGNPNPLWTVTHSERSKDDMHPSLINIGYIHSTMMNKTRTIKTRTGRSPPQSTYWDLQAFHQQIRYDVDSIIFDVRYKERFKRLFMLVDSDHSGSLDSREWRLAVSTFLELIAKNIQETFPYSDILSNKGNSQTPSSNARIMGSAFEYAMHRMHSNDDMEGEDDADLYAAGERINTEEATLQEKHREFHSNASVDLDFPRLPHPITIPILPSVIPLNRSLDFESFLCLLSDTIVDQIRLQLYNFYYPNQRIQYGKEAAEGPLAAGKEKAKDKVSDFAASATASKPADVKNAPSRPYDPVASITATFDSRLVREQIWAVLDKSIRQVSTYDQLIWMQDTEKWVVILADYCRVAARSAVELAFFPFTRFIPLMTVGYSNRLSWWLNRPFVFLLWLLMTTLYYIPLASVIVYHAFVNAHLTEVSILEAWIPLVLYIFLMISTWKDYIERRLGLGHADKKKVDKAITKAKLLNLEMQAQPIDLIRALGDKEGDPVEQEEEISPASVTEIVSRIAKSPQQMQQMGNAALKNIEQLIQKEVVRMIAATKKTTGSQPNSARVQPAGPLPNGDNVVNPPLTAKPSSSPNELRKVPDEWDGAFRHRPGFIMYYDRVGMSETIVRHSVGGPKSIVKLSSVIIFVVVVILIFIPGVFRSLTHDQSFLGYDSDDQFIAVVYIIVGAVFSVKYLSTLDDAFVEFSHVRRALCNVSAVCDARPAAVQRLSWYFDLCLPHNLEYWLALRKRAKFFEPYTLIIIGTTLGFDLLLAISSFVRVIAFGNGVDLFNVLCFYIILILTFFLISFLLLVVQINTIVCVEHLNIIQRLRHEMSLREIASDVWTETQRNLVKGEKTLTVKNDDRAAALAKSSDNAPSAVAPLLKEGGNAYNVMCAFDTWAECNTFDCFEIGDAENRSMGDDVKESSTVGKKGGAPLDLCLRHMERDCQECVGQFPSYESHMKMMLESSPLKSIQSKSMESMMHLERVVSQMNGFEHIQLAIGRFNLKSQLLDTAIEYMKTLDEPVKVFGIVVNQALIIQALIALGTGAASSLASILTGN